MCSPFARPKWWQATALQDCRVATERVAAAILFSASTGGRLVPRRFAHTDQEGAVAGPMALNSLSHGSRSC